jgi:Mor family transcriptional regulator
MAAAPMIERTPLLDDCQTILDQVAKDLDIAVDQVTAEALMAGVQKVWGGTRQYIPVAGRESRDDAIRAAFNGTNHQELARQFDLSLRRIYEILARR